MFKLDDNLLIELGLGTLPPSEKNRMLAHIYETLEMRVGMKLAQRMTNEQLDEFEAFIDRNDEPGALKWLESNFPNYKQVVADELETLKQEIKVAAPQIVASSQQAQQQTPVAPGTTQGFSPVQNSYAQPTAASGFTQNPVSQPYPQAPPQYQPQPSPVPQFAQPQQGNPQLNPNTSPLASPGQPSGAAMQPTQQYPAPPMPPQTPPTNFNATGNDANRPPTAGQPPVNPYQQAA